MNLTTLEELKYQINSIVKQISYLEPDTIDKVILFLHQCILKHIDHRSLSTIPVFFNNKINNTSRSNTRYKFGAKYYIDTKTRDVVRIINMPQFRSLLIYNKKKNKMKHFKEIKYFQRRKTFAKYNYCDEKLNVDFDNTNTDDNGFYVINKSSEDNFSDNSSTQYNEDNEYKCYKCDITFLQKQQLNIHLKNHEKYKCRDCSMTFSNQKLALKHKKETIIKHNETLTGHDIEGLEKMNLKCFICPRTFPRAKKLKDHMQAHAVNNLISCPICNSAYKSKNTLDLHMQSHEKLPDSNYEEKNENQQEELLNLVCDVCGKTFSKKTSLTQHKKRSHGEARYSCDLCNFTSKSSFNLKRHSISHTSERPVMCDQCGTAFRNPSALKEHILYAHNKDCQHQCEMCPKKFKVKGALSRHFQSCHSTERPYACRWCKQAYKRSSHLRRHELQRHADLKIPQVEIPLKSSDKKDINNVHIDPQQDYIEKQFQNEVYMDMQWTTSEADKTQLHSNNALINLMDTGTSQLVNISSKDQAMKQMVNDFNGDYLQSDGITYQALWNKQEMSAMNIANDNLKYVTDQDLPIDKYVTIDLNAPANQVLYLENTDNKIANIAHGFPETSNVNIHATMNQGLHQNIQSYSQECNNAILIDPTSLECAVNNEHNDSLSVLSSLSDYIHTPFSYV